MANEPNVRNVNPDKSDKAGSAAIPPNPDVTDVGCPSCDYGLPYGCTCVEEPPTDGESVDWNRVPGRWWSE